jgi:hypothetical protein
MIETSFLRPVLEDEVENAVKILRGKLLALINGIADLIVNKCIEFIKKKHCHI